MAIERTSATVSGRTVPGDVHGSGLRSPAANCACRLQAQTVLERNTGERPKAARDEALGTSLGATRRAPLDFSFHPGLPTYPTRTVTWCTSVRSRGEMYPL